MHSCMHQRLVHPVQTKTRIMSLEGRQGSHRLHNQNVARLHEATLYITFQSHLCDLHLWSGPVLFSLSYSSAVGFQQASAAIGSFASQLGTCVNGLFCCYPVCNQAWVMRAAAPLVCSLAGYALHIWHTCTGNISAKPCTAPSKPKHHIT